jgi:hypothetical protein
MSPGRYNPALHRLSRVLVHENQCLAKCNLLLQQKEATKFAYEVRPGFDDELFSSDRLAVDP